MLIIDFLSVWPDGHQELCNEVESGNLQIILQHLHPLGHPPQTLP